MEVIIGPEGIKMEKEKMKGVLEWPMPKCVKDVQKFLGLANVKIVDGELYFIFSFHFYFTLLYFFF